MFIIAIKSEQLGDIYNNNTEALISFTHKYKMYYHNDDVVGHFFSVGSTFYQTTKLLTDTKVCLEISTCRVPGKMEPS